MQSANATTPQPLARSEGGLRTAGWRVRLPLLLLGLLPALAPAADVPACGTISSNTTWSSADTYVLSNCSLIVAAGATLTIPAGTVVKAGGSASAIIVDGRVEALGSESEPVAFTSLADDSRDGDTNANGPSSGASGDWYGFLFRPGSSGRLEHFFLGYAGSGAFNSPAGLWNRAQVDVDQAAVELRDGEIAHGLRKGVHLNGDGITPVLQRLSIRDNVREAGNTSSGAIGYAIYQTTPNMQPSYADLSLSGNELDAVLIYQWNIDLSQDLLLAGAPFRVDCGYTVRQLNVPSGRSLTIAPGTQIDFSDPWGSSAPYGIAVSAGGSLVAEGEAARPIVFTSSRAAAGDGSAHFWYGIWAKADSQLRLAHCDIGWTANTNFGKGAVQIDTSDAQLRDCRLHHGSGDGLYVSAPNAAALTLALQDLEITDNSRHGIFLEATSASALRFELDGGQIDRNGHAGINTYTSNSSIDFRLANLSLSGNGVLGTPGNQIQTAGIHSNAQNVSPALDAVSLIDNAGAAVYWYCNGSFAATGLSLNGNQHDTVRMPSCDVYGGREWDVGGVGGIALEAESWVTVKANAFLSIRPGSVLRFPAERSLSITGGTLFALGTSVAPIRFLGQNPVPGGWWGIQNSTDGSAFLSNCEIAHGGRAGSSGYAGLYVSPYSKTTVIQNCDVHDNVNGIVSAKPEAVIRSNTIRDNSEFGVRHGGYTALPIDARDNWWGVASGPFHATLNPAGEGNPVSDNVLFDPWLQAPPEPGELVGDSVVVSTGAPDFVSPGQTVDYSVAYLNLTGTVVQNAVVVMQLPTAAQYLSSTHGGVYWPERDQVIWALGDVPAGDLDTLGVTLRFIWGLPRDYRDGTIVLFSGDNYQPELFSEDDRADYLAADFATAVDSQTLTPSQFADERALYPALDARHGEALADGYDYFGAAHVQLSNGASVTTAVYAHPTTLSVRTIGRSGDEAYALTFTADAVTVQDGGGGFRLALDTGQETAWGDWSTGEDFLSLDLAKGSGCTFESCLSTCRRGLFGLTYLGKTTVRLLTFAGTVYLTGGVGLLAAGKEITHLYLDFQRCELDCTANPNLHCCREGQVKWTRNFAGDLFTQCFKYVCGSRGAYKWGGSFTCTTGTRCVASIDGQGCVPCDERISAMLAEKAAYGEERPRPEAESCAALKVTNAAALPRCKDLELFVAKDPNEIIGPDGDLLPGQTVDYIVTYENEGLGRAYGVYIVNLLPPELDESTLIIDNGGWYLPATRQLVWVVGELGPKGDPDSEGAVSYSVAVRPGLASGTVIANQAVVHFPSVPEETPTNTWVNQVQPLAAIPQVLETAYQTPLAIVLEGREVSSLPLDYSVVEPPARGALSGTAPNLTYTPAADMVGEDSFAFVVDNGTSQSRPAQVLIRISSTGDATAPELLSTVPAAGETGVGISSVPLVEGVDGAVYAPVVVIAVSERLDDASVSAERVRLLAPGGVEVPASVRFDATRNRILLSPQQALDGETLYTVSLAAGMTDLAGNPLAPASWQFSTGVAPPVRIFGDGFE